MNVGNFQNDTTAVHFLSLSYLSYSAHRTKNNTYNQEYYVNFTTRAISYYIDILS